MFTYCVRKATYVFCQSCILKQNTYFGVLACQRTTNQQAFHTSSLSHKLNEFFSGDIMDGAKVEAGRPWKTDELRLKSNEDLHKLWYVLLKERNMLLTLEEMYLKQKGAMASPERIEKVEESMENVMSVVRERDEAYKVLEHGESLAHPGRVVRNAVGLPYYKNPSQHYKPRESSTHYKRLHLNYNRWMDKHLVRYEEVLRRRHKQHVRLVEEEKQRLESLYGLEGEDLEAYVRDRMDQGGNKLQQYLNMTAELNDHAK